jgi:hypothetical protein
MWVRPVRKSKMPLFQSSSPLAPLGASSTSYPLQPLSLATRRHLAVTTCWLGWLAVVETRTGACRRRATRTRRSRHGGGPAGKGSARSDPDSCTMPSCFDFRVHLISFPTDGSYFADPTACFDFWLFIHSTESLALKSTPMPIILIMFPLCSVLQRFPSDI